MTAPGEAAVRPKLFEFRIECGGPKYADVVVVATSHDEAEAIIRNELDFPEDAELIPRPERPFYIAQIGGTAIATGKR